MCHGPSTNYSYSYSVYWNKFVDSEKIKFIQSLCYVKICLEVVVILESDPNKYNYKFCKQPKGLPVKLARWSKKIYVKGQRSIAIWEWIYFVTVNQFVETTVNDGQKVLVMQPVCRNTQMICIFICCLWIFPSHVFMQTSTFESLLFLFCNLAESRAKIKLLVTTWSPF